jgi:hypothetical protein
VRSVEGLRYLLINHYFIDSLIFCETEKCFSIGTRDRTEDAAVMSSVCDVCACACVRARVCVCARVYVVRARVCGACVRVWCVRVRACARALSQCCAACWLQQRHTGQSQPPNTVTVRSVTY